LYEFSSSLSGRIRCGGPAAQPIYSLPVSGAHSIHALSPQLPDEQVDVVLFGLKRIMTSYTWHAILTISHALASEIENVEAR
jgi:hypothetical protein